MADNKWEACPLENAQCVVFDFDHTLASGHLFWFTVWCTGYGYDATADSFEQALENAVRYLRHAYPTNPEAKYNTVFAEVRDWCKANGQLNPDNAENKKKGGPLPKNDQKVTDQDKQAVLVGLFGGAGRVAALKSFLNELTSLKIKLVISSKGVHAVMTRCLERMDMLKPFSFIFGFDWLKGTKGGKPMRIVEHFPSWGLASCKSQNILFVDDDFRTETKFAIKFNLPFYSRFGLEGLQTCDFNSIMDVVKKGQKNNEQKS